MRSPWEEYGGCSVKEEKKPTKAHANCPGTLLCLVVHVEQLPGRRPMSRADYMLRAVYAAVIILAILHPAIGGI